METSGFFGYNAVQSAIDGVISNIAPQLDIFLNASKGLAIAFVTLNLIKDWIKSTDKFAENVSQKPAPITLERIIFTVAFITLIANTNTFLGAIDDGLKTYVSSFKLSDQNGSSVESTFNRWCQEYEEARQKEAVANQSSVPVIGDLANTLQEILDLLSTGFYFVVLMLVKGIAWVIHALAYPIFLIERGFLLFIMKLVAPLVFVMGTLDAYRDLFFKWIKVYCAIFITGLFFIAVTWFCDELFFMLSKNFLADAYNGVRQEGIIPGMDVGYLDRHLVQVCFYTMIVLAKVKLYQSSISLSNRIFA